MDLGYYYTALDYTVANLGVLDGGSVTILPGTAIAVRNENDDPYISTGGLIIGQNATCVAHGRPDKPITFTVARWVQEQQSSADLADLTIGAETTTPDLEGPVYYYTPPLDSFRFCDFFFPAGDYLFSSGAFGETYSDNSSASSNTRGFGN